MKKNTKTKEQLLAENEDLRRRLEEAEETLRAIQEGEVDALVLSKPQGDVVFTLKGAEHPYRVFVEAMNEGAATLDPEGTILYCNNRFAEMLEIPADQVIGSSIYRFISSADRAGFESAFQGGKGEDTTADIFLKRKDQGLIPVHLSFNILRGQDIPVVCLVAMDLTEHKRLEEALRQLNADLENRIQDRTAELRKVNETLQAEIVERERAGEALQKSEERLALAASATQIGMFDWNLTNGRILWTETHEAIFGYAPATTTTTTTTTTTEHDYRRWADRLHPEDLPRVEEESRRCMQDRKALEAQYRIILPDGSLHWVETKGVFLCGGDGIANRMLGVVMDITERKEAEAERERLRIEAENERRRLEAVLEALPVGLAITDPQGGNIRSNRAFEQIWGGPLPRTESIDDYSTYKAWWADTGKPVDPEEWASAQAVRKCEPVSQQVMKIQRFDGSLAFVINSGAPVFDEHNQIAGCAVAIQDITALREAEEELRRTESRFRLLSETAGQLLATDDPQGKIYKLCRNIMEHLDCQIFFNFLADEQSGKLHLNACAGIPEEEVRKIEWLDYGVAVCGCVARDKVRLVAENIGSTPDTRTDLVHSYGVQAYACHPLLVQGRLIGTLSFGTKTRTEFSPEDLALMRTVTDQVSTAMERSRLIRELQRSRDELEMRVRERTAELELLNQALKTENELRLESEIELRESENRLRQLSTELLYSQEKERRLVAQDLHDSIGSSLAAIKFKVEAILSQTGNTALQPEAALQSVIPMIQVAIHETRRIQKALRPPVLDELGILATIRWFCREFESTYTAVRIRLEIDIEEEEVPDSLKIVIFRVLQEALNNIAKYSGADLARLSLRKAPGRTELVIEDHGQGFDLKEVLGSKSTQRGLGLTSMRERTELSGGTFSIDSGREKGTVIRAVWPV